MFVVEPDFHEHAAAIAKSLPLMRLVALRGAPAGWFAWEGPMPAGFAAEASRHRRRPGADRLHLGHHRASRRARCTRRPALLWNVVNATLYQDLTSRDHVLTVLPMFHVGGLCIQTLPALHAGATVTIHARFDPGAFLRDVAARRPTLTLLVPATIEGGLRASRLGDGPISPACAR